MSQENVEVVRRFIQELEAKRDELPSIIERLWEADADYYPTRKHSEAAPCHGREEVARFMVQYRETWDRFEWPIKELIAAGDGRVLAITTMRAHEPTSGIKLEGDLYCCVWLRHGLIFRWEDHVTLAGALHALGFQGDTLEDLGSGGVDGVAGEVMTTGRSTPATGEIAHFAGQVMAYF